MSIALKWIVAIIVLAGAGWLLWWSGWLRNTNSNTMQANVNAGVATTTQATSTTPSAINGMSATNDSSDAAVAQDAAAVDVQMQALGKDNTAMVASLNDKPVTQSY